MFTTLIDTEKLHQLIQHDHVVILDCRAELSDPEAGHQAYLKAHIPGAFYAHLENHLSGKKYDAQNHFLGRHPLPDTQDLLTWLRACGVENETQVVAYDAHGSMFAARLWWLLRSIGHEKVAVLDGGWDAWMTDALPFNAEIPLALPSHSLNLRSPLTKQVDLAYVRHIVLEFQTKGHCKNQIVDARAPDRFRGENETIDPIGGHIPSARNRFFKDNLSANGFFKTSSELREEWREFMQGAPNAQNLIMQCGSGVTACHNLLALELAGYKDAALFPGSWSQWCADASRPIER